MDREWALLEAARTEREALQAVLRKVRSAQQGLAFQDLDADPELSQFQVVKISSNGGSVAL